MFIGLHYKGKNRLFNISNISAISERDDECKIYVVGDPDPFPVDEAYEEIITLLRKGLQYEI